VEVGDRGRGQNAALVENAESFGAFLGADLERFSDKLELNPGPLAHRNLEDHGFQNCVLSSGFSFLYEEIFEQAGVDYAFFQFSLKADEKGAHQRGNAGNP